MKKSTICLILILSLLLLCACGTDKNENDTENVSQTVSAPRESKSPETDRDTDASPETDTDTAAPDSETEASVTETEHPKESDTVDPNETGTEMKDVISSLKRGINLKTVFEPEYKKYDCSWMRDPRVLPIIKEGGFDHIRIPAWINSHLGDKASGYKIDDEFLDTLDDYVKTANELGLITVVDYHDADALFTSKSANEATEIFLKVWEQLSNRFAKYPDNVMFELINEPKMNAMSDKLLSDVQLEAYNIIREKSPTRPIAFATNDHNASYKLDALELPGNDENIIVSVHTYAPLTFTHQQLDEMGAGFSNAVPYSSTVELALMDALNNCKRYKDRTGVNIWLSEFGMSTFIEDTESVEKYLSKVTDTCKEYGISYCYWAFGVGAGQDFSPFNALTLTWKDFVVDNLK